MDINLSAQLLYYLSANNMTVGQLSDKTGISSSYLNDLVNGKMENPGIKKMDLIVDALGSSLPDFFMTVEQKQEDATLAERIRRLPAGKKEAIKRVLDEFEKR